MTGPVMVLMALLVKVNKKNFPGRAYVSQIDDPSYKICKELTDILNPIDERRVIYKRYISFQGNVVIGVDAAWL